MPAPTNILLIEGTFEELADELAGYIDEIQKKQNPDAATVRVDIAPLLEKGQRDDALKKLVMGSSVLNSAPERGVSSGTVSRCRERMLLDINLTRSRSTRIHSSLQPPRSPNNTNPANEHIPT